LCLQKGKEARSSILSQVGKKMCGDSREKKEKNSTHNEKRAFPGRWSGSKKEKEKDEKTRPTTGKKGEQKKKAAVRLPHR